MKYLKRFNEELKSDVYRRASRKLAKKGMQKRANTLSEWGDVVANKESLEKWKRNVEEYKKFGTFKIQISDKDGKILIVDDFYIELVFDGLGFADNYECAKQGSEDKDNFKVTYSFPFQYSIIPTSEDQIAKLEEVLPEPEFSNGSYWAGFFGFDFDVVNGRVEFTKTHNDDYDNSLTGVCKFSDRLSAVRLRNLLKSILMNEVKYPSAMTHISDMYEYLESVILAEVGMSGDYGFELKYLADFINRVHVTDFPGFLI